MQKYSDVNIKPKFKIISIETDPDFASYPKLN